MKKYNKVQIMKKAWEIKRKLNSTLSLALRMSWVLAKKALNLKEEFDMLEGEVKFNIWSNYGKVRAYYTCSWRSSYQNNKGYYVAL